MKFTILASLLAAASVVQVQGFELTVDNWDEAVADKILFVKMFAPWCGHCKKMKPFWDQLMEEYKDSETKLIADVDCTSEGGEQICQALGVKGYPTLKYGDPEMLKDYEGGREYDDLKKFIDEDLKPFCSVDNIEYCDDNEKALIEEFSALSVEELDAKIAEGEAKIAEAYKDLEETSQVIQHQFGELSDQKDAVEAAAKEGGLDMWKRVAQFRKLPCSPFNLEHPNCTDEVKAKVAEFIKMTVEELETKIAADSKPIADAEAAFEAEMAKLKETHEGIQEEYNTIVKEKDEKIEAAGEDNEEKLKEVEEWFKAEEEKLQAKVDELKELADPLYKTKDELIATVDKEEIALMERCKVYVKVQAEKQ